MGNQMRLHAAVSEVHQVKPRCARRKGEVGDADKIPVADASLVSLQRIKRTTKQMRIDPTVDAVRSSESEPASRGNSSKACKSKIDKKAAGKYQDIELQRN
jgi:hypothetical protein